MSKEKGAISKQKRKAKRSNSATGTVAGVTDILEDVSVTAEVYRQKMAQGPGSVFAMIRKKMWWFKEGARFQRRPTPEAGRVLYIQQDGARPHTTDANLDHFASQGGSENGRSGFRLKVITQPAQSPDLNCLDLAFFASLQSDVEIMSKSTRNGMLIAVQEAFDAYDDERMAAVWRRLVTSYKGILETGGDNHYETHRHVEKDHRHGLAPDHDVPVSLVQRAEQQLALLEAEEATGLPEGGNQPPAGPVDEPVDSEDEFDF